MENRNFSDATLWAVSARSRDRLGTVTGKASEQFTLPWPSLAELAIEIHMLAGQSYRTPRINVTPGDRLQLYIERPVNRSVLQR